MSQSVCIKMTWTAQNWNKILSQNFRIFLVPGGAERWPEKSKRIVKIQGTILDLGSNWKYIALDDIYKEFEHIWK